MSNEWKMMKLEDVCDKQSSNIAQNKVIDITGNYQLFGASGYIKNINFYKQENEYVAIVKDGAGVGRVMKLPAKSSILGTLQYIVPKDNIDINYLYYSLLGMNLAKYASGATIPHIYFKNYCNESVFLPSKDKQQEIAGLLDKARELVEKHKVQLAELDLLAESVFYDMFGDPVTNEKGWEIRVLNTLCDKITDGTHKTPIYKSNGIIFVSAKNIKNGYLTLDSVKYISQQEFEILDRRCNPKCGDVLICKSGSIGFCTIIDIDIPIALFESLALLKLKKDILNNVYFKHLFNTTSVQNSILKQIKGNSIKHLHLTELRSITIILPLLTLQTQFANRIEKIEQQKSQVRKALKESEDLFQRLMQDMFNPEYHNK